MSDDWLRVRFKADAEDWRPIVFPPPGPAWCSGYGDDHSIVVAYVRHMDDVTKYWPEATDVDCMSTGPITFSGRFPQPEWWTT